MGLYDCFITHVHTAAVRQQHAPCNSVACSVRCTWLYCCILPLMR